MHGGYNMHSTACRNPACTSVLPEDNIIYIRSKVKLVFRFFFQIAKKINICFSAVKKTSSDKQFNMCVCMREER